MKKTAIAIVFLLGLLTLASCHKDKEIEAKSPVVSGEEMTVAETQASISWKVDYVGSFHTGVDVSTHENMSEARRVEANKVDGKYVAVVDGLTAGTKYYYRIVVWNKYGNFEEEVSEFETEEKTFYQVTATCSPAEGGRVTGAGSFEENKYCTLNAISNQGYNFVNWTENGNPVSTNASYTFKVTQNRNLVAHFSKQKFTVSVSATPSAGGTVSGGGQYDYGQSCTVSATAASGYTFSKWTEDGIQVSTNANYTFTVNSARTLVAHFTALQGDEYNVNVSANPSEGGTVAGGGVFQSGASCTVTATANTGYTFANWTENGSVVSSSASYTFTVNANRTLVANFTAQSYTISVSANPSAGGSATGGGTYHYGETCTVSATPNTGFTFVNWRENGSFVSSDAEYSFVVYDNRTLVAHFAAQAPNTYNITLSANPTYGGSVSGGGSYEEDQTCTVNATANDGYTFIYWMENSMLVSTEASYTFTVYRDRDLMAHFEAHQNSYTVTVSADPSNGGTVSGGGSYNYGQNCTVHATANSGYLFTKWTENGTQVSTDADYTFTVTGDCNLVAHFSVCYTITVSASPSNGGTVSGGGSYSNGQGCVVRSVANSGYTFVNWTENGNVVSTDQDYGFVVTRDRTLVANFNSSGGGVPQGAIDGLFTINSDGDQVYFSQGNLQFQASNQTWRFAGNQWSYIGEANSNISQTYNGWIDLFGWGTSGWNNGNIYYCPWDYQYSGEYGGGYSIGYGYGPTDGTNYTYSLTGTYANADWGYYNAISNGGNITQFWRTLTSNEWNYVLFQRSTGSGIRYARARITGISGGTVDGLVLLPDDWNSSYYSLNSTNSSGSSYSSNEISSSTWINSLQAHGAVFLPAAGLRNLTQIYLGSGGSYWTSGAGSSGGAKKINFADGYFDTFGSADRYEGLSVRLVRDANP